LSDTESSEKRLAVVEAAMAYFAVVFSCAFLIGICRVLFLAPVLGKTGAVLIELPIVLAISWFSSGFLIRRFRLLRKLTQRLAMGGIAFAITMVAEVAFSTFAFGQSLSAYLEGIMNLAGVLGLSSQLGFALIPAIQLSITRGSR
jgi:hypothetical protein